MREWFPLGDMPILVSFVLSLLVGGLAHRGGALTGSGWAGAVLVGTLTAGLGGWEWGLLVILFFVSSSALSRFGAGTKARLTEEQWEKGDRRDLGQVLANGGLVALLACLSWPWPSPFLWGASAGVLAAVTADTWATEVGVLSRRPPRLITTGRRVPAGTSGGVTLLGTTAALAGSICIGLGALIFGRLFQQTWQLWILPAAVIGGIGGVLSDSLLGATVQSIFICPRCQAQTERRMHSCGTLTLPLRGWHWLGNDLVNIIASGVGGLVALLVARLLI